MVKDLREKIILAAIDTTAEKGIENLHVREIAKLCNVSSPAMYYHFKNKYELLVECMLYNIRKFNLVTNRAMQSKLSFKENYLRIMRALAKRSLVYRNETIFYNRVRIVPLMEIKPEDRLRLYHECITTKFFEEGIKSGVLINVDNILSLAYYPLSNYLMHCFIKGKTPTEKELNDVIYSLWRCISAQEGQQPPE